MFSFSVERHRDSQDTVFIRLQAEQFLPKSSLILGKFEAVEGVSAYSRVFLIKKKNSQQIKTVTNDVLDSHPSLACKQIHKICPYTIICFQLKS